MKIGFDAKRLYCNFTGLGNYSRTLVKNLYGFFPQENYYLYTPNIKTAESTNFFRQNLDINTHVAKNPLKAYWRSFSLVKQIKKDSIDLYHGLSNELPPGLRRTNIKSIVTVHDLIFKNFPNTYGFIDRNTYDIKFRQSCNNADKILAISENTKQDIIQFYNIDSNKIEVIYQSCDSLFYTPMAKKDSEQIVKKYNLPKEYLLFVGSIAKRKNLEIIINAYNNLHPKYRVTLVIVGNGKESYKKKLTTLIHENKLEKNVIWISNLKNNHHLQAFYQEAIALIYPSFYEGFGLPVVEALLSKTPVITSNTSSLPEAGGNHSLYVNPNDSEELAEGVQKILTDTQLRKNMIKNGYKHAMKTFAPQETSRKLMELYQKIL